LLVRFAEPPAAPSDKVQGTSVDLMSFPDQHLAQENIMNGIIYIVGLVVVVGIVLSFIGVHF
jgi:hypothetical protein